MDCGASLTTASHCSEHQCQHAKSLRAVIDAQSYHAGNADKNARHGARKIDPVYPGTAVARLEAVHQRLAAIPQSELDGPWPDARRALLRAGGLRDLPNARPGQGYTGHAFNDYNHCDLTTMLGDVQDESNADGSVAEISRSNLLGPGIREASLPELGEGGSWSTCTNGCASDPPRDVAHIQFRSRIAFKLIWTPADDYSSFVLVDDDGKLLRKGTPQPPLPAKSQRQMNCRVVQGSKYAVAADAADGDPAGATGTPPAVYDSS